MANIKQSEQAVLSSMKGKVPMTGAEHGVSPEKNYTLFATYNGSYDEKDKFNIYYDSDEKLYYKNNSGVYAQLKYGEGSKMKDVTMNNYFEKDYFVVNDKLVRRDEYTQSNFATNSFPSGASIGAEIGKQANSLSSNLAEPFTEIGSAISSSLKTSPTTINSFWQETENMIIGSQEWNAAYQNLSIEKQSYLQSYGRLYDYINNPVNVSGANYNFAADSSGLAEMSTYLEKVSLEVEEVIHSIYAEINSIQENGDWKGEAFLAFQSNCLKYKEPLLHLVLLIKSFSSIFASLGEETDTLVKSIVSVVNGSSLNIKPSFQQPLTPYQLKTQFDEYNLQNKMKNQQDN